MLGKYRTYKLLQDIHAQGAYTLGAAGSGAAVIGA